MPIIAAIHASFFRIPRESTCLLGTQTVSRSLAYRLHQSLVFEKAAWPEIIGSVFGPFSAKLGPQAPLERRSSFCSAGCTKYQAGRLILRPCRGTKKNCGQIAFRYPVMQVGPRAYAGWLQVPRSETGAELNLGGLPPPRASGGLKGGHSPARGSAWGAPYDSAPIPFQTGGLL